MTHPDYLKEVKGDWASLFKNNRNNSQGIKLEKLNGVMGSEVLLEIDDLQDVSKVFGSTLIGYVAGKSTGKLAIVQCCNKWKGKEHVIFHRRGWVVIRFASEQDRDRVLEEGPYNVFDRPFLLKPIQEMFDFSDCEIRQVPVWVQFPNFLLDLWTGKALSKLGSRIGIPLNTDKLTRTMDRVCYARILMEVDVAKELPTSIFIRCPNRNVLTQKVEGCPRNGSQPNDQKREPKGKNKIVEEQGDTTEIRATQIGNKGSNRVQKVDLTSKAGKETGQVASVSKNTEGAFTVVTWRKQRKQKTGQQETVTRERDSTSSCISDSDETESLEVGYYAESNRSRYNPRKGSAGSLKIPKPIVRKTGAKHKGAGAIPPLVK